MSAGTPPRLNEREARDIPHDLHPIVLQNAVTIVIPAAGLSRRMGDVNKLIEPIGEFATLLDATLTSVAAVGAENVVLVTGHQHDAVAATAGRHEVTIVHNPRFEHGMGASLKAGVAAAPPGRAVMIWPADMPFIRPDTVRELLRSLTADIVVRPVYLDKPGHPVLFGASYLDALLTIPDDEGARRILSDENTSVTRIVADDPGVVHDFDTPDDFKQTT